MDYKLSYHMATPDDAEMLSAWDEAPHMKIARGNSDWWNWQEELHQADVWREMLIVKCDGEAFGFLQIMNAGQDPDDYWQGLDTTHMAIDLWIGRPEYLHRGFGSQMIRYAISRAFRNSEVTTIWIDPLSQNARAIAFYQKHGFEPVDTRIIDEDGLALHKLTRQAWEICGEVKTDGGAY